MCAQLIKKVNVKTLKKIKDSGEKFSVLTAYDYSTAKYLDEAGIDVILIGDSLAMVALGYETTHSVGVEEMKIFTKAVAKGVERALVVTDMPFLSYHTDLASAVQNCGEMIKSGANAVKIEGCSDYILEVVKRLVETGIPVMGHLGLTPQSINKFGTYAVRAQEEAEAQKLIKDAHLLESLGCFAVVLEKIPAKLAARVSEEISIPVIGIGAGGGTDGQVLVMHDMLGINKGFSPRFLRRYANVGDIISDAVKQYIEDVKSRDFPNEKEQY